jgi:hypothetical protein
MKKKTVFATAMGLLLAPQLAQAATCSSSDRSITGGTVVTCSGWFDGNLLDAVFHANNLKSLNGVHPVLAPLAAGLPLLLPGDALASRRIRRRTA